MSYHGGRWRTFVSWLSHTSTNTTFFSKPQTTFFTCFSWGERQKYAQKKLRLNQGSNSQPPGHESDMLTTELPAWDLVAKGEIACTSNFSFSHHVSTQSKIEKTTFVTFNLLSANAFNLVGSKILSCGKGLRNRSFADAMEEENDDL